MEQKPMRNNTGALFRNERKETEKHPDYKGNITVDNQEYWFSAWIREGAGGKYLSCAVSPREPAPKPSERSKVTKFDDGDLPF
jgi:hypothetical protein